MKAVELVSVSKAYAVPRRSVRFWRHLFLGDGHEKRTVLTDFSLTIHAGEKVVIAGPNARGKTTLLKLAGGYIRPERGEVRLFGMPARKAPRGAIGLMLSTQLLYPLLTGYQNLEYTAHLLKCADWKKRIDRARETWGLEAFLHEPVSTYSNGRRALLALARATLADPKLLLLDEPTSYLDAVNADRFLKYLESTPAAVLVTTQEPERFGGVASSQVNL